MEIDWPREFNDQLDRLEVDTSPRGRKRLQLLTFMLKRLRDLEEAPVQDTAMIKRVRQSRKHLVWRVSHPYVPGVALRVICWFPPTRDRVVVALFSGDKASMGDVFYDTVGTRADRLIDRWLDETKER
ncbi:MULTISPECIES: hypothetical protein [Curtobacterium]|jgi:hypothetical protein|uniref:hypothetical protein n=1 Tax=Curtobacterium TaxID=2034 RepID=UPI000D92E6A0|nr:MULTISPECIES: hypothetical protein [Curtobacterium]MCS6552757.1 hypothetical protein [Curtobacterium flaccumfaciens pv. flaccumfaciens]PYY59464.1 hypothetical protein DEJ17_08245 [Curtobacterium sp. MCSS17_011]PZE30211.1 hypothetical protein DEJ02_04435 [Curtobacterium sp. MCLR17_042]